MTALFERGLASFGAVGAGLGVAASAVAAHRPGATGLDTAARFLLLHGIAVLAVAALIGTGVLGRGIGRASAVLLLLGTALFSGDLAARTFLDHGLFPMAAPTGGTTLMAGWLGVAVAAWAGRRLPA